VCVCVCVCVCVMVIMYSRAGGVHALKRMRTTVPGDVCGCLPVSRCPGALKIARALAFSDGSTDMRSTARTFSRFSTADHRAGLHWQQIS